MSCLINTPLKPADHIAIIDCQIFVPEFIPVLIALGQQSLLTLPFQNGAFLNLSPQQAYSEDLIGNSESEFADANVLENQLGPSCHSSTKLDRNVIQFTVAQLVEESSLEPIIQLRRVESLRERLQKRLEAIIEEATLDEGQMQSFLNALKHPVHCTLG